MFSLQFVSSCFIVLLCLLLMFIYIYLTKHFNYWKNKKVPFKKPILFFGNYFDFLTMRTSLGGLYNKLYKEFPDEKIVGVYKTRNPDIMIKDLELIKHILVKDFQYFQDRSEGFSEHNEPLNMNLFNVEKHKWKIMRRKFSPIFTPGKLRSMFHLILEKGDEFQKLIESSVKDGEELELRDIMEKFTIEVIGSCAFGIKMNSISDTNAPFRAMGRKVLIPTLKKSLRVFMRIFSPTLFTYFKLRVTEIDVERFFISTVKEILKEREESGEKRHDFIDLLMELRNNNECSKQLNESNGREMTNIKFTDAFITAQVFVFFLAGYETSSMLMAFVLNELAFHPEIQEKVFNEIEATLSKYDGKLTFESVLEMKYLEMVVCEAQRKYPALAILTRICNTNYKLPNSDITIDKGISVCIPVLALHYDPKYYPEPKKFIPERFSPEAISKRHPMVFLPFGEGPRNCIGSRFGKTQSKVGLILFISKFFVEPTERSEKQVKINPSSFGTTSKNGIWLKVIKRERNTILS